MQMMKKLTMAMLLFSMALPSFAQKRSKSTAKLSITASSKFKDVRLTITREWPTRKLIDTLHLAEGKQEFLIADSLPAVYSLSTRRPYANASVLLDGKGASISFNEGNVVVAGGKLETMLQKHRSSLAANEKEWQELGRQYGEETDMEKKIPIEKKVGEIAAKVEQERLAFVKENSANVAGAWMADSYDFAWSLETLNELIPLFEKQVWASTTYQKLHSKFTELNSVQMTGKKAPAFTLTSLKGTSVSLDNILQKNEYVLIDVWASWCTPCRAANRKLAQVYPALKKKGIEFVSISVDDNHAAWGKAVEADKIPWMQLLSDNAMKGTFVTDYHVKTLPTTFLVNKQGTIIKQNIEIADLEKL